MKKTKPIYVLGTGLSHDGSACLLKDGKIVVAIEKERITRKKHQGYNDDLTIKYCLDAEGIELKDVDLVVQCGDSSLYAKGFHSINGGMYGQRFVQNVEAGPRIVNLSHHLAHAYNAVGTSPFDEMAVLVIDGRGQEMKDCMDLEGIVVPAVADELRHLYFEKDSFYEYKDGKLTPLYKDFSTLASVELNLSMFPNMMTDSIGEMYEKASSYCLGESAQDGGGIGQAGKLMGLAPYGTPGVYTRHIFDLRDGRVFVKYDWQADFHKPCRDYADFKANFQYYADIAYWVQREAERAILYVVNERKKLCSSKKIAYTGGVALNAVANAKIRKSGGFEDLYLTPAAGDNGLAIGCAYYGWLEILKKDRVPHNGSSSFGKVYPAETIQQAIENYRVVSEKNLPAIITEFFAVIPSCVSGNSFAGTALIRFHIAKSGVFFLRFDNNSCTVLKDTLEETEGIITISGNDLIRLMLNYQLFPGFVLQGKIQLEGNIPDLLHYLDKDKIKSALRKIIAMHENEQGIVAYSREENIASVTAGLLSQGKVIGWFQGSSEFGPRALGNRSIIADPRKKDIQRFINSEIKFREDFRPFAPAVLLNDVSTYFQYEGESPYMIMVAQVQPEWKEKIPGVVHQDNSCRIQTVTPKWNERYFDLLSQFKEKTGVGVLLNTSFNMRGMPIVETPDQALSFFHECALDYLVMDNFLICKSK